jgi:uncharacterized membrane protein YuzA (DUF378 family)
LAGKWRQAPQTIPDAFLARPWHYWPDADAPESTFGQANGTGLSQMLRSQIRDRWNRLKRQSFLFQATLLREAYMRYMNLITLALIIIGGLNWLAMGVSGFDVIGAIFGGTGSAVARVAYVIVGLAAVWQLMPGFQSLTMGEVDAERHMHHQ